MTSQKGSRETVDTSQLPNPKLLKQQFQKMFGKKPAPVVLNANASKPKEPPFLPIKKPETKVQPKPFQSDFSQIMKQYTETKPILNPHIRRNTSRQSRNFDLNPQLGDVIVIHPNEQNSNSTYKRISSRFSQQMQYTHKRSTLSECSNCIIIEKIVQGRLNHLLDQWFTYSEHENRIVRGVPVLVIKTFAKLLDLQVPQNILKADRTSSIIISREQFCDNVLN